MLEDGLQVLALSATSSVNDIVVGHPVAQALASTDRTPLLQLIKYEPVNLESMLEHGAVTMRPEAIVLDGPTVAVSQPIVTCVDCEHPEGMHPDGSAVKVPATHANTILP